jgi:tubulin--tyrosine ligase-like protein 12
MGLPEPLHRRLYSKLKFNDFDINEKVQLIIDEDDDKMYLRAIKDMKANEDVFLVDHAWTFKQRGIYQCLKDNEKLRTRLENLLKYSEKRSLGIENPYKKKRPTLEEYLKQVEESKEPVKIYDLDEYEIEDLKKIPFREEVEEISLWDNKLNNPAYVTTILMKLPNLKACWLNSNPMADNCSNFNVIGDHFDKLEIFNSTLTCKAGEWAMLFYARDTGAKTLEEITTLNLNGKNLLMVDDISFLKKMVNLTHLDISNNVDMYKPAEMLAAEAKAKAEGSQDAGAFDFLSNKHDRNELLNNIPSVEHLVCDLMLEVYIIDTRESRGFLPNLKTINKVPIEVTQLGDRTLEKKILELTNGIWKVCSSYRLVKPGRMDEEPTFYINDEVGTSICHCDTPNSKITPLIYSPNCEAEDP